MTQIQIGDRVRFLNSVGGGRVVRIEGQLAYVDEDGFETPVLVKECVVVARAGNEPSTTTFVNPGPPAKAPAPKAAAPAPVPVPAPAPIPVVETAGGDVMNIVMGYEPVDIKRLSETTFDLYMVNDSNYFVAYTYLTKADGEGWVMRARGVVEPNIQEFVCEVKREDLKEMDRVAVQLMAWKEGRNFELKPAMTIDMALDITKFFKLHCFKEGEYFDRPTLEVRLVTDDRPRGQQRPVADTPAPARPVDLKTLEKSMRTKKNADMRGAAAPRRKEAGGVRKGDLLEVDLHIDELLDTTAGLSPADILNHQIDEFRRVMDANLKNHGMKIVFIHGKGEGVLRNALTKELAHRYKQCRVQDASFQEYGYGATQVTIP